ncbi:hypothetical protein O6H91_17G061600 [Diphasiastrum complanatum]|uniref:Uncharacterized protein n=2 Tax=Diphasiastrum complanatum TaxID=34168 RepID=A0ACC2B7D7_DIPCM|nr:hypothetical protein O6H91_17G061600 [Diphasiastrum complanatum]KAJ7525680.1 hypothetical protein O6H91_17G061600 [Diphasiastrum complanatum]
MGDREGMHISGASSSRKDKKKQVKEERDRLKQAEKKKRRLEKALANAAAMRSELEKKKQKRKEEEQRLDKEGAALAEAVALQVLVDEDSDVPAELKMKQGTGGNGPNCAESFRQIAIGESTGLTDQNRDMMWRNFWKQSNRSVEISRRVELESKPALMEWDKAGFYNETSSGTEEKTTLSNVRAKVAEMVAGSAAVQAVAALGITKEAKTELEAEASVNESLDKNDIELESHFIEHEVSSKELKHLLQVAPESPQKNVQGESIERERDELKARLEYTERKLREKTRQVSELEHDLEEVTQYLMEFKAMFEISEESDAFRGDMKWKSVSSRHDISTTESSGGTVDQ